MTLQNVKPLDYREHPFPRYIKRDRSGCYHCNFCGSNSNLRNAKFIWVEDIHKHYSEHYMCGYCIVKWERRNK